MKGLQSAIMRSDQVEGRIVRIEVEFRGHDYRLVWITMEREKKKGS